jgi:UDP-galactopyranose mutase
MFEEMLAGIPCHLGCSSDAWRHLSFDHLIYTGSIDEYFREAHGLLEYRSLDFHFAEEQKRSAFQLNECNHFNPWTRSVDHSHWLDQKVDRTIVSYEYPCEWEPGRVRMYPKPFGSNPDRYKLYRAMAEAEKNVTFVGRLATYKYLDMDDVIAQTMLKVAPLVSPRAQPFEIPAAQNRATLDCKGVARPF